MHLSVNNKRVWVLLFKKYHQIKSFLSLFFEKLWELSPWKNKPVEKVKLF